MPLRFLVFLVFLICPDTSYARSRGVLNADNPFNSDGCVHTPSTLIPCMLLVSRTRLSVRAFARRDRNKRGPCVVCSPISLCVHTWLLKPEAPVDSATAFQLGRNLSLPLPSPRHVHPLAPVACSSCRCQASPLIRVHVQSCTPTVTSFAPKLTVRRTIVEIAASSAAALQHPRARLFLPFPLSRCVCVAHSLSFVAQVVQPVEKHTLGARFCHIMFLFGL